MTHRGLGFWDALVIQAALRGGADILLTEDFEHGRAFAPLTVRNPFFGQIAGADIKTRPALGFRQALMPGSPVPGSR